MHEIRVRIRDILEHYKIQNVQKYKCVMNL